MADQSAINAVVVTKNKLGVGENPVRLALFNPNGTPRALANPAAAQANSTASTIAELVTDFNALLAKLRAAGVMLP